MSTEVIQFKVHSASSKVDLDKRIITGVIIAQVGEAQGHGFHVEQEFIDTIALLSNKKPKKQVKSFFGHNWDNLGKQVGFITNVRVDGDKVLGDLEILKSADKSPLLPNMGAYLLDLAKEDKTSVMLSVRFERDYYYQYDKANTRIKVHYYNSDGYWVRPIKEHGKVFVKMKKLKSVDMVEDGALTDKLFSSDSAIHQFQDLINTPEFPLLLEEHYTEFRVLNDFYSKKKTTLFETIFHEIKSIMPKENKDLQALQTKYDALQSEFDAANESILGYEARVKIAELNNGESNKDIQLKLDIELEKIKKLKIELKASDEKLTELEAGASTDHTDDDGNGDEGTTDLKEKPWLKDGINQRAMSAYQDDEG